MELRVNRAWYGETFCGGVLKIDGKTFCHTIEPRVREPGTKIDGETAIPSGRYKLLLTVSSRFKKLMPELVDVPGFLGVRIHSGNTSDDSRGCILVGRGDNATMAQGRIRDSRVTFELLMARLQMAYKKSEEIWITIV